MIALFAIGAITGTVRALPPPPALTLLRWLETPHDPADRAIAPLIGAGKGDAEGFELSVADSIAGDEHSTQPVRRTRPASMSQRSPGFDDDRYGAGDDEDPES
jgi:hypothetical protein